MPHKMTLTGKAVSPLRENETCYSFDMEESGSPSVPKGLPGSSVITYTVFLNNKQLKKAGLTDKNIQSNKIMVQGEPTLDVSVDDCPGEIGVICFQVSIIPEKQKQPKVTESPKKVVKEEMKAEEKLRGRPEGTEDFISIKQISVPESFLNSYPNPEKTKLVVEYVKQTGHLDEPIVINRDTRVLTDGYRRYLVAKEEKMDLVPIMYEKQPQET